MKIYSSDTRDSLYHYTLSLMGLPVTDTTTIPKADFMRSANVWYHDINEWIWQKQNYWQHDDSGRADLPIGTTDLVDNQQDYTLPTGAFDISRVEVKDQNGNTVLVKPIAEVPDAKPEFYETAGLPLYYELVSNVLTFYPKPSSSQVTLSEGLTIYSNREVQEFSETSTWEPGIPKPFQPLIAMGVVKDKSFTFGMDNLYQKITIEINNKRKELEEHFAKRHRNLKRQLTPRVNVSGI